MTPTLEDFDYPTSPAATFSSHARTAFRPFEPVTPEKQRLINQVVTCTTILADVPGEYWTTRLAEAQAEFDQYIDAEQAITAALGIVEYEAEHPLDLFPAEARSTTCQCAHPDAVVAATIFCALCGGDVSLERVLHLYDEMQDIADARRESKNGVGL